MFCMYLMDIREEKKGRGDRGRGIERESGLRLADKVAAAHIM